MIKTKKGRLVNGKMSYQKRTGKTKSLRTHKSVTRLVSLQEKRVVQLKEGLERVLAQQNKVLTDLREGHSVSKRDLGRCAVAQNAFLGRIKRYSNPEVHLFTHHSSEMPKDARERSVERLHYFSNVAAGVQGKKQLIELLGSQILKKK